MKQQTKMHLIKESIILLMIVAIFFIVVMPFSDKISNNYLLYYMVNIFLVVQYFRVVLNERKVIWIQPLPVKIFFGFGNIALFILSIRFFMNFIVQFEDYNFNGVGMVIKDIYPELSAHAYKR